MNTLLKFSLQLFNDTHRGTAGHMKTRSDTQGHSNTHTHTKKNMWRFFNVTEYRI